MRSIGVVTTSRADYGIYLPVLKRIKEDKELSLYLIVTGMHLSPEFGLTANLIEADGFRINEQVESLMSSDTPEGTAKSMGLGTIGFAQSYARFRPDILLVLGDRFEMHSAVVAALPFKIPIAHIAGGESSEGLIDESIRHSITKMSHLHFPSTEFYANRIIQMGEEPWRVTVCGSPGLDNINDWQPPDLNWFKENHNLDPGEPLLLVTFHPVTLEFEDPAIQINELLVALKETKLNIVFTYPNADTRGRIIIEMINNFSNQYDKAKVAVNLGTRGYFGLMQHALAMVGNSSSGIIEAASFRLPVVDIGNRQKGRIHGKNVIHVDCQRDDISKGINRAISLKFKESLGDLVNLYGDGNAAEKIINRLKQISINEKLFLKRFHQAERDSQ